MVLKVCLLKKSNSKVVVWWDEISTWFGDCCKNERHYTWQYMKRRGEMQENNSKRGAAGSLLLFLWLNSQSYRLSYYFHYEFLHTFTKLRLLLWMHQAASFCQGACIELQVCPNIENVVWYVDYYCSRGRYIWMMTAAKESEENQRDLQSEDAHSQVLCTLRDATQRATGMSPFKSSQVRWLTNSCTLPTNKNVFFTTVHEAKLKMNIKCGNASTKENLKMNKLQTRK